MNRKHVTIISIIGVLVIGIVIFLIIQSLVEQTADDTLSPSDNALEEDSDAQLEQYTLSTIAGSGQFSNLIGHALEASFRHPGAVSALADGSILISDTHNHILKKLTNDQVDWFAGMDPAVVEDQEGLAEGYYYDDILESSFFNLPIGLAEDPQGNLYIADAGNHSIRKLSSNGEVSTLAGDGVLGLGDGQGTEARFYSPSDLAIAEDGTIYVADTLNHLIRSISPTGEVSTLTAESTRVIEAFDGVAVFAGDFQDGLITEAKFNEPTALALDSSGNLYVSDTGNQLIRYINFEENSVTTVAGTLPDLGQDLYALGGYADGATGQAMFHSPRGIALTEAGQLVIADSLNHTIRLLTDGEVITIAGQAHRQGFRDGAPDESMLYQPSYLTILPNGDIIIADTHNQVIRKLVAVEHE